MNKAVLATKKTGPFRSVGATMVQVYVGLWRQGGSGTCLYDERRGEGREGGVSSYLLAFLGKLLGYLLPEIIILVHLFHSCHHFVCPIRNALRDSLVLFRLLEHSSHRKFGRFLWPAQGRL
jgi:hypothetical protein